MSDVEVNGVHIADDRSGDGPPLVLVVRLPDVFNRGMIELFESGRTSRHELLIGMLEAGHWGMILDPARVHPMVVSFIRNTGAAPG
jgi:hypothetical protein